MLNARPVFSLIEGYFNVSEESGVRIQLSKAYFETYTLKAVSNEVIGCLSYGLVEQSRMKEEWNLAIERRCRLDLSTPPLGLKHFVFTCWNVTQ